MTDEVFPDHRIRVVQVVGKMMCGGVESTILNHYRFLNRDRIQFEFFAQEDSTHIPYGEIEALGGRVHLIPSYTDIRQYLTCTQRLLEELRPDIVHSNMNAMSVFPLFAAKRAHVPIRIVHSHSTADRKEGTKTVIKNMLRPFAKMYPTAFATCGDLSGRWLFGDSLMNSGGVKLVRNAIDLDRFSPDAAARARMRRELGVSDGTLVVGQVGRLCFQKNQMFSLLVFKRVLEMHPDAVLLFAGADALGGVVERAAENLGIRDHVRFLGVRSDVQDLYRAFDVFLFPSNYEGLPVSLIETQAVGCPALVSTNVTREAQIAPNVIHFLSLDDPVEMWARKLVDIADVGVARPEDGAHYLREAGYDIVQSGRELSHWYQQLVAQCKVLAA